MADISEIMRLSPYVRIMQMAKQALRKEINSMQVMSLMYFHRQAYLSMRKLKSSFDEWGNEIESAPHAMQKLTMITNVEIPKGSVLRKKRA